MRGLLSFMGMVALFFNSCGPTGTPPPVSITPKAAPEFSAKQFDGKTFESSQLRGKLVLITIWASWHPAAPEQVALWQRIDQKYKDQSVQVIGVSIDAEDAEDGKIMVKELGVDFPLLIGDRSLRNKFDGIEQVPTTFVIRQDYQLANKLSGPVKQSEIEAEIRRLFQEFKDLENQP